MSELTVGIVGLGNMGGKMAQNLLESDYDVIGFDIDEEAIATLEDAGGESYDTPADTASASDVVVSSLPKPPVVKQVYMGEDGVLEADVSDTPMIEMSTIDPETMKEVADAAAEVGGGILGAPVSGGPANCRRGTLTVMAGGEKEVFDREDVQAVLNELGANVYHTGEIGSGNTLKLINNTMSMGNLLLSMEATSLAAELGVEGDVIREVLTHSAGASNTFKSRIARVLNRNFEAGFTVDLARKDVGLALDAADKAERPMFLVSLIYNLYTKASADGYGEDDIASVVKIYEEMQDEILAAGSEVDETNTTFEGY